MAVIRDKGVHNRQHVVDDLLYAFREAADDDQEARQSRFPSRLLFKNEPVSARRYIDGGVTHVEEAVLLAMDGRGEFRDLLPFSLPKRLELILEASTEMNRYAGTGNSFPPYYAAFEPLCLLVRYALSASELTAADKKSLSRQIHKSYEVIDSQLRRRGEVGSDLYPRITYNSFLLSNLSSEDALFAASLDSYKKDFETYARLNAEAFESIRAKNGWDGIMQALAVPLKPIWVEAAKIGRNNAAMDVLIETHTNLAKSADALAKGTWFYANLMTAMEVPEGNPLTEKAWDNVVKFYESCVDENREVAARGVIRDVRRQVVIGSNLAEGTVRKNEKIENILHHCESYAEDHKHEVSGNPLRPVAERKKVSAHVNFLLSSTAISRLGAGPSAEHFHLQ